MKNKVALKAIILLLILTNFISVLAFDGYILNFENGTGDWTRVSSSGEMFAEYTDALHKNALYVNSPGVRQMIKYIL